MRNISLCIIARDEGSRIAACIQSVRALVDEAIVIDTGSTDDTRHVAIACGARVSGFSWCDDFSAARNAAIAAASRPWIFSMDADDLVDEANHAELAGLFGSLGEENVGYMMQCASVGPAGGVISSVGHVRLFRNDPRIRWDHRVHEQIASAIEHAGGRIVPAEIVIQHHGYKDPEQLKRKRERNMRLLDLEAIERPLDAVTQFHRGWALAALTRYDEAIVALNLSEFGAGVDSLHRKRQGLLARCYFKTGARTEAMEVVRRARRLYPEDGELLYTEAQLLLAIGDVAGAEDRVREVLSLGPAAHLECMDTSIFGWAGFYLLGLALAFQDRASEAEDAMRSATSADSTIVPAWIVLADALMRQGRRDCARDLTIDPCVPPIARALVRAGSLALGGAGDEALKALPPSTPGEHALLAAARRWVPRVTSQGPEYSRLLDLLRS
jgi:glycosyltransferase involved in cell wall biosynthesis